MPFGLYLRFFSLTEVVWYADVDDVLSLLRLSMATLYCLTALLVTSVYAVAIVS